MVPTPLLAVDAGCWDNPFFHLFFEAILKKGVYTF